MDFRDILKSFDNLSEGEKTTTDKGTVHKSGPGGYGNKHGSEDVTDQYGKPVGRMSLGKLGAKNEPKRGKGRPPNPDKAKEYDSTGLNKAMGIGKPPKPTGKPSVKHSLKEYFDQMDEALSEAGLAVQPMPATPQQKQQQAVATKPSFMIKDPANPNMPAITTQDPAVVQAAKNGTMSMQKPGAAPTTQPGATPAAGAGSQVAPMEEDDKNWIKGAIKHPGAFTKKASSHGMTPKEFANKVLAHKADYPAKTEKQATLAKTLGKMHNEADMEEGWKGAAIGGALGSLAGPAGALAGAAAGHFVGNDMAKWGKDKQVAKTAQAQKPAQSARTGPVINDYRKNKEVAEAEAPQHFAQSSPLSTANRGVLEGKKGVNPFAKKDTNKKPDADKDGVPDWADKKPGKDDNEGKKKGAAPKKGVNPFAKKDDKKKVKEGMDSKLQAARLRGKSHALSKEAYNCHYDDMEESRCYHEGFKEGLDECYGQMPILGRTRVGEVDEAYVANPSNQYDHYGDEASPEEHKAYQDELNLYKTPGAHPALASIGMGRAQDMNSRLIQTLQKRGKPVQQAFGENEVGTMASYGAHDEMDEAYVGHLDIRGDRGGDQADADEYRKEFHLYNPRIADKQRNSDLTIGGFTRAQGVGQRLGDVNRRNKDAAAKANTLGGRVKSAFGMDEGEIDEMDKTSYMKQQAIKTPGDTFKAFGQTMSDKDVLDELAFEALDKQLNAILEGKEVSEGMTVSISKGQQGSPDSVSVSAQDGEADQLLSIIKSAGMGLFGGDEQNGYGAPQGSAGAHGGISVVDDHDGMMALMKKLSGGGEMQSDSDYESEEGHGEEGHGEEACGTCGQAPCGCEQEQVDEVESEDQMEFEVAENAPDSGADNTNADVAGNAAANSALATADAGADEEEGEVYSSPTNEAEDETGEEAGKKKEETVAESFANLYKKLAFLSEESIDKEEDEKAEKAGKKVAKDIEYDEGHKGKDDNKAEKAGKKVTKDIEYDDKKDKKEKKLDEWANEAGKNGTDAAFEADIDFMTKVISGGLNKQKSTGQTTIPVINGQNSRMGVDGLGSPMKESTDLLKDYMKLSGL